MKVIITEDIIKNALNESIDEFMLEEGMNEGFGSAIKGVWNGLKNAGAMYMDWRTNGQWNQKYGINPNFGKGGSGTLWQKTKEIYIFNNWLKFHSQRLWNKLYNKDVETYNDFNWKYDDNPSSYIQKNVTPQLFNSYIGKYFRGYYVSQGHPIFDYITKLNSMYKDPYNVLSNLNINSFFNSDEGKKYSALKQQAQTQQQQQPNQPTNQSTTPKGKKDPGWHPTNEVPIFNIKK